MVLLGYDPYTHETGPIQLSGYYMYRSLYHPENMYSAHTVDLYLL
jgi:hypothetical protein